MRDLNRAYRDTPALYERDYDHTAFWWLEPNDAEASVFAFARIGHDGAQAARLRRQPHAGAAHGLPRRPAGARPLEGAREHRLVVYGGSDMGNYGGVEAEDLPWMDQYHSAELALPPLARDLARPRRRG